MAQTTFAIDDEAPLIREEWVLLVKMRADWKCTRCGVRPTITRNGRNRRLHAHHINHDPSDHRLANGECLCSGCHSSHHRSTRCAFRNSELQRELGLRVTPEAKKAAGQKASATRRKSPEREAARIASLISKAAAQPPEALSARAVKGWDTRWKTTDAKTHCRNGHLRTPENTGVQSGRWRLCLDCKRDVHIRRREAGK